MPYVGLIVGPLPSKAGSLGEKFERNLLHGAEVTGKLCDGPPKERQRAVSPL